MCPFSCSDINECASFPCAHGGTCNDFVNAYTCDCASGWTGPHCSEGTPRRFYLRAKSLVCPKVDCFLLDPLAPFRAKLRVHLHADINECASNPCTNGDCNNQLAQFVCSCDAGWTGSQCELGWYQLKSLNEGLHFLRLDVEPIVLGETVDVVFISDFLECNSMPCMNNGVCDEGVNAYNCSCEAGYAGVHCETGKNLWPPE